MNYHVFFPSDLTDCLRKANSNVTLLGHRYGNAYIAVQFVHLTVEDTVSKLKNLLSEASLEIIATTEQLSSQHDHTLAVQYDEECNLPKFSGKQEDSRYTVVLFNPPNHKSLEYFSVRPILLQSIIGQVTEKRSTKLEKYLNANYNLEIEVTSTDDQAILDKVNAIRRQREMIHSELIKLGLLEERGYLKQFGLKVITRVLGRLVFPILKSIVVLYQRILIYLIYAINRERFYGTSLVKLSQVFRQIDLRLQQLNYFPIQFLCFYDKAILYNEDSELRQQLVIPGHNADLNINNSNYINFFNSIWMIVNDVLLGITLYKLLDQHKMSIISFINETVLDRLLFKDFRRLITWISFNHPAGFKLNNELGSFMGQLFLWSINTWNTTIHELFAFEIIEHVISITVKVLCYGGGTLFICFVVDCLNIISSHTFWSYHTSARIYKKQVDIIKSLFWLFHGKKYNLLRNRIDNLDNYSEPGQFFEVDQLLMGTLFFMILILLLPTTFAFYLTFFSIRLCVVLSLNFLENILIVLNFVPLFVIVLKLKNSKRLQGGVTLEYSQVKGSNVYLELHNKSLSYSEIFKNFKSLFVKAKNFRTSIFAVFFRGDLIGLNRNHKLKYTYLMLPEHFEKTIEVWDYFN